MLCPENPAAGDAAAAALAEAVAPRLQPDGEWVFNTVLADLNIGGWAGEHKSRYNLPEVDHDFQPKINPAINDVYGK